MTEETSGKIDRHEIDCVCGNTSTGGSRKAAEVNHLLHFLNEHDDLDDWERDAAEKQLQEITED